MMQRGDRELPLAVERMDEIRRCLGDKRPAFFLDYDGTLTPIVPTPEEAVLAPETRDVLAALSRRFPVAVVSGRDRRDVERMVGLANLVYAGSHGFDIAGPGGLHLEHAAGSRCREALQAAAAELVRCLRSIPGARVEKKRFAVAVHYRNVAGSMAGVEKAVRDIAGRRPELALSRGKKVFELRPAVDWDKGRAVLWLLEALGLDTGDSVPVYLGDDLTDEDAFRVVAATGVGIVVGEPGWPTAARFRLTDPAEVRRFLAEMGRVR